MNAEEMIREILNPSNAFTISQLREISNALNARFKSVQRLQAAAFRVGDKISFVDSLGNTQIGHVKKINPKNILVTIPGIDGGLARNWNVSPSLLSKVA